MPCPCTVSEIVLQNFDNKTLKLMLLQNSAGVYLHRNDLSKNSICSEPVIALVKGVTLHYLTFGGNEGA